MMSLRSIFIFFLLIGRLVAGGEQDSLRNIIKSNAKDSSKVVAYTDLVISIISDPKAAMETLNEMHVFCDKIRDKRTKALCYRKIGILYSNLNYFDKALEYTFKSADLFEAMHDTLGLANCYNNIGSYYHDKGSFTQDRSFHKRAIEYHLKSMELRRLSSDPSQMINSYNNIGSTYMSMDDYEKALEYFNKAYDGYLKAGDKNGIDLIISNLGDCYLYLGKRDSSAPHLRKALSYYLQVLNDLKANNPDYRYAGSLNSVGQIYYATGNKELGVSYLLKSLEMARQIHDKSVILDAAQSLLDVYEEMGDHKKALEMMHLVVLNKDSLVNEQNGNKTEEMLTLYQSSQKDKEIEKLNNEKSIMDADLARSRTIIFSSIGAAMLILILMFVLWRGNQAKKKANKELENAYAKIEETNTQITDSINYSKRIQNAILPPHELLAKHLPNFFVYYAPKDIVSGDFYWFTELNSKLFFIVVDCTGHGVPGALMSMIGNTLLNEIINQKEISDPGEILNQLNKGVKHALRQSGSDLISQDDGMDVSVCCLDKTDPSVLRYATANHTMFIKANGKLSELHGDIYSIGGDLERSEKLFHTKTHTLEPNSFVVMSSDGFYDQFGGPKNKKFLITRFEELILSSDLEKNNTASVFENAISKWRGSQKQTDDICVVGFKA
jgi:serine phosphatase RsbU (regulator of sigma subunit)